MTHMVPETVITQVRTRGMQDVCTELTPVCLPPRST